MDYSEIIRDLMEDEGIMTSEIPERSARQGVRGFADMKCCNPSCSRTWSTHKGHVVIDLKRQNVQKVSVSDTTSLCDDDYCSELYFIIKTLCE